MAPLLLFQYPTLAGSSEHFLCSHVSSPLVITALEMENDFGGAVQFLILLLLGLWGAWARSGEYPQTARCLWLQPAGKPAESWFL